MRKSLTTKATVSNYHTQPRTTHININCNMHMHMIHRPTQIALFIGPGAFGGSVCFVSAGGLGNTDLPIAVHAFNLKLRFVYAHVCVCVCVMLLGLQVALQLAVHLQLVMRNKIANQFAILVWVW